MAQDTSRRVRNMAALGGAVLLGSTFLTAPASAQSVDELRAQIDALQQRLDQIETQQVATPVIAPAQAVTAGDDFAAACERAMSDLNRRADEIREAARRVARDREDLNDQVQRITRTYIALRYGRGNDAALPLLRQQVQGFKPV